MPNLPSTGPVNVSETDKFELALCWMTSVSVPTVSERPAETRKKSNWRKAPVAARHVPLAGGGVINWPPIVAGNRVEGNSSAVACH